MTEGQLRDIKVAGVIAAGGLVTIAAWPFIKNVLALLKTTAGIGSAIAGKTEAAINFLSGSCGIGQGNCQTPSTEAAAMQKRFRACSARAPATRHNDEGGSLNPCFPDTDHTDVGLNFVYDPQAAGHVPVALPPELRKPGFNWGPRFQFQLNGWRNAMNALGVLDLYKGMLGPQCGAYGDFIHSRAMGETGQWSDSTFWRGPCNSVYWNYGAEPQPFEAIVNAWLKQQGF